MSEKEKKKKTAMDNLLSGLTSIGKDSPSRATEEDIPTPPEPEQPKGKGRRGRPPRSEEWETAYIVVNKEHYGKIKEIANMSGKNIKDIVENAFADYIKKFERKFGTVRIRRKIDLDAIDEE